MFSGGLMGPDPNMQNFYRQQMRIQSQQQFINYIQALNTFNNHNTLASLIQNLTATLSQMKQQIKMVCQKNEGIKKLDQDFNKRIKIRIKKIRDRNNQLTQRVLNTKQRLSNLMQNSKKKDKKKQAQYQLVQEKIKKLKNQIGGKLHYLKMNKDKIKKQNQNNNRQKYEPLKINLTQLKDGTQVLFLEVEKARQQMNLLKNKLFQDL